MSNQPERTQYLSYDATRLMEALLRTGGGMRVGPLLRRSGVSADGFAAAANELQERLYIEIIWRGDRALRPARIPERFRDVRRLATTRVGRHCYPFAPKVC